jgi:hypothetical protein
MNASVELDDDRPPAFGQEANLDLIADLLTKALEILPPFEAGLALVSAGLDILPAAHCRDCYRKHLELIKAEVERLLAEGLS